MGNQVITVNGHVYQLWAAEYAVNCDYIVEWEPATPPYVTVGKLMWMGNGETTFDYKAFDIYGETLGIYPTMLTALGAIDAKLYPS